MSYKLMLALASTLTLSTTSFADAPASGSVTIQSINYSGNGCPQGSVATNLSSDGQAMTVMFDDYVVESEGRPERKSCTLDIELDAPAGWSYGLFCVDVRGFASLDENVVGQQSVEYSFGRNRSPFGSGRGRSMEVGNVTLEGPVDTDYSNLTVIPVETLVWAPCGQSRDKTLKIKTDISIKPSRSRGHRGWGRGNGGNGGNGGSGGGLMTVDSVDGELSHHYGIAWKRCASSDEGSNDLSGFSSSKSMPLGRRGSCTNKWHSTSGGQLVMNQDECSEVAQGASRFQKRMIEQRIKIWEKIVEVEFKQWRRLRDITTRR